MHNLAPVLGDPVKISILPIIIRVDLLKGNLSKFQLSTSRLSCLFFYHNQFVTHTPPPVYKRSGYVRIAPIKTLLQYAKSLTVGYKTTLPGSTGKRASHPTVRHCRKHCSTRALLEVTKLNLRERMGKSGSRIISVY